MAVVIDGTNGITTPLDVEIQGSTSGSIVLAAPAVAGTNTQTLVAASGTLAPLISGTAVASTSGTSIDFTGIPSWVKRITVMFNGVSTNGASNIQIQLGDSGGIEATGYLGSAWQANTTNTNMSTGLLVSATNAASLVYYGGVVLNLLGSNAWAAFGNICTTAPAGNIMGGTKTLSDTLTQVRITTVNGTDTFDAGTINIMYE